jgi:hypothetical protein
MVTFVARMVVIQVQEREKEITVNGDQPGLTAGQAFSRFEQSSTILTKWEDFIDSNGFYADIRG